MNRKCASNFVRAMVLDSYSILPNTILTYVIGVKCLVPIFN